MTKETRRARRGVRRLLEQSLFAGASVTTAPQLATVDAATPVGEDFQPSINDDSDDITSDELASLERMNPFDATHVAATAAVSSNDAVRLALAHTLGSVFPLVGDDFVLHQLLQDSSVAVRTAASRASRIRGLDQANSPRVLVIDDYVVGRAEVCAVISELGCHAIGAPTAITESDLEWPEYIDMIVANHEPPYTDGPKLAAQLRERAPDVPVIVMAKPIRVDDLECAIDSLVTPKTRS